MAEPMIDIQLLGAKELSRQLNNLDRQMAQNIVRRAMTQAAKPVVQTARALVRRKSGRLAKSIKSKVLKSRWNRGSRRIGRVIVTGSRKELGIPADASGYYPSTLELGSSHVPAKPYLRPAIDRNERIVRNVLRTVIGQGIDKQIKKG